MRYVFIASMLVFAIAQAMAQVPPPGGQDFRPPFDDNEDDGRLWGNSSRPPMGGPDGNRRPPFGSTDDRMRPSGRLDAAKAALKQPSEHILHALKPEQEAHTFNNNVRVMLTGQFLEVESDGIPNHPTADYPNSHNPNRILPQDYHFSIPLYPKFAETTTRLPFGPIGVAVNGIPFYNPYNAQGRDAVFGPNAEIFDSCCGHPDPRGRYHYHKYPLCVNSPFRDPAGKHSPLIGWAFDGFAIYGPNGEDGHAPADLDQCNGHIDALRGYHYHVTAGFPYILGAYRGVVEMSNFDGPVWGR